MTDTEKMREACFLHDDMGWQEKCGSCQKLYEAHKIGQAALSTTRESHTLAMEEALEALKSCSREESNTDYYDYWFHQDKVDAAIASLTKALGR